MENEKKKEEFSRMMTCIGSLLLSAGLLGFVLLATNYKDIIWLPGLAFGLTYMGNYILHAPR